MQKLVMRFITDDSGATAIAGGRTAVGNGLGTKLNTTFNTSRCN
jgi:Flp pilus assembly pilin Flp